MSERRIVSRHFLRRTARAKERKLSRTYPHAELIVEKASRGPFRWWVIEL